jgi:hypothetical protein
MLAVNLATQAELRWAQAQVTMHHYLHRPVDSRCSVLAYLVTVDARPAPIGCLIFGRPEATRCYQGELTYGSVHDVQTGRAQYSRWELINLARVWADPVVQRGGALFGPAHLPGFYDRRGEWRSTLITTMLDRALDQIVVDYLVAYPPCFLNEPYMLRECISYCDTTIHAGTIYHAAGFRRVRRNARGLETWARTLRALTPQEDRRIGAIAQSHPRSRAYRAARALGEVRQQEMAL